MPYIKPEYRGWIETGISELLDAIEIDESSKDGKLNYAITRLIDELYEPSYSQYNRAIGVLECVKLELYRRLVAPYEDTKISENGDVYIGLLKES